MTTAKDVFSLSARRHRAALAEIERLRAEAEEAQESLTAAYLLGSHEKAHEQAAKIKELEAEIGRLRDENAFLEKVIHKKNIRLNELEDALEADAEQSEICIQARLDVIDQQAAKILELEADVLQKSMIARKLAEEVAEGKIGPDVKTETSQQNHIVETDKMVPTGNCWQITEERVEALGHVCSCLDFFYIPAKTDEALRVMLEEAQP